MKINITLPFSDEEREIIRCGRSKRYGDNLPKGMATRQELILFIGEAISSHLIDMRDFCDQDEAPNP